MAQTFFIDSDEEIISVIGYLRKSPDIENCFVFPKRSLVLQSAVNLRLFQREAEKQGKKITIISQDENGRQLAERVGIPTKEYATEINSLRPESSVSNSEKLTRQVSPDESNQVMRSERAPLMPPSNHLGSDTFSSSSVPVVSAIALPKMQAYPSQGASEKQKTAFPPSEHRLRIRDTSPRYQTSLNSVRNDIKSPDVSVSKNIQQPAYTERVSAIQSGIATQRQPASAPVSVQAKDTDSSGRNQRLERFFQREPGTALPSSQNSESTFPQKQSVEPLLQRGALPPTSSVSKPQPMPSSFPWKTFTFSLISILIVSGVGVSVYFFLPKASVLITPHEITHDVEAKFEGRIITPIGDQESDLIPVRKIEKSYESSVTVSATGRASSGNQKSRGTLVISNEYSSDAQPLIATTRFETSDGKIFRLAESTTVPGMTIAEGKRQPGVVEAIVIADAPGEMYNIAPTDFTITGFKGGPKYEKIRATSSKSFSGGGGNEESMPSVTKEDVDSGLQQLKEQSKQDFLTALQQELLPDERLLEDSLEVIDTKVEPLPLVGSLGERFDIRGGFTGRAFVVSEKILKEKLAHRNLPERKGVAFYVTDATLSFESVLPQYDEDKVIFSVRSTLMLSSLIETDALQEELLGLDEDGIKSVLEKHLEIKKIEVSFSPEFLFHNIPKDKKRVSVRVITEQ